MTAALHSPPAGIAPEPDGRPVSIAAGRAPFTALPNCLYGNADHWEIAVIFSILWHGDRDGCYESQARWAERLGMSTDRLHKTLQALIDRGWLEVEERRGDNGARLSNRYRWVPWDWVPPEPKPAATKQQTPSAPSGTPSRPERHPLPLPAGPPAAENGTPYRSERHKQDSEEQDSEEQDSEEQDSDELLIPPSPPGGDGLAAVTRSNANAAAVVMATQQPLAPSCRPPLQRPAAKRAGVAPTQEQALRLMALWNEHKPDGWNGMSSVNATRWGVVKVLSDGLGGIEPFFEALPLVLRKAANDSFWGRPGHDWNSFMGYGKGTGKGHFVRFLEQEIPLPERQTRADGSLTLAAMGQLLDSVPRLF